MPTVNKQNPLTREQLQQVFGLYSARRLDDALIAARALSRSHPDQPVLMNMLGAIHAGLGQADEAIANYKRVLELYPDAAETHFHLGNVLRDAGKRAEALECYIQASRLKPNFVEAHSNVCQQLEQANRLDELRGAVARAKQECAGEHPALRLREGELMKHEGETEAARRLLESPKTWTADADTLEARAHLLGDLCDQLDDVDAAFAYATQGNRICAEGISARAVDGPRYIQQIEALTNHFNADWVGQWSVIESSDTRPDPVFLVGFPRSGTTLLDTILRSHPDIAVLEEKPTVSCLESAVSQLPGGYPSALAKLTPDQLAQLREAYFTELDIHLEPRDRSKLIVDKLPLNLVHGGLLQRVFPQARFIMMERHPCDSVLSCYMRPFKMNEGMVNFLELHKAAALYDAAMRLWQQYRTVLPLSVYTVRYERLIENFEETLAPLFDFLSVDWHDSVRNYRETAYGRTDINTPSYNQVTQPLYTRARGRWERYRAHMEAVLPTLLPWALTWGYSTAENKEPDRPH